jgi:hypothetical protein
MTNESAAMSEALRQGQRDREQGWPFMADAWGFTGWAVYAYQQGYDNPRTQVRS